MRRSIFAYIIALSVAYLSLGNVYADTEPAGVTSGAIQDFKLVSENEGWLLYSNQLYWTEDGGIEWFNISPNLSSSSKEKIQAVEFIDSNNGWAILLENATKHTVVKTTDGGNSWQNTSSYEPEQLPQYAISNIYLHFVDTQTGWVVLKHATSSNFSVGTLFKTTDGGGTWNQLDIPAGRQVYFVSGDVGWTVGGAAANEIYRTENGGETWYPQNILQNQEEVKQVFLPVFKNSKEGVLAVFIKSNTQSKIALYSSNNSGMSWSLIREISVHQDLESIPVGLFDLAHYLVILQDMPIEILSPTGTTNRMLPGAMTQVDMVSQNTVWALYKGSQKNGRAAYTFEESLLRSVDGGKTWQQTALPHDDIDSHSAIPRSTRRSVVYTGEQGFDTCAAPSIQTLQNWITSSPYKTVNLYIGGENKGCRSHNSNTINKSYVAQVKAKGWKIIPTWVGLQGQSTICNCTVMSSNLNTAYSQGRSEAEQAANTAINLGLLDTIIYYDLEAFHGSVSAAQSFIRGWVSRLHERGIKAGLYGSAGGSHISDFASINPAPDAVWIAIANLSQYTSSASQIMNALGVQRYVADDLWRGNRIYQYTGGHNEVHGGITLNIDSDLIDGPVEDVSAARLEVYDFWRKHPLYADPNSTLQNPNFDAQFKIKNFGTKSITIQRLALAVHNTNGGYLFDLSWSGTERSKFIDNLTLSPEEIYHFEFATAYIREAGTYKLVAKALMDNQWNHLAEQEFTANPPIVIPSSGYSWHGNGSIISYHGSLLPNNAGKDWPYGITQDVVQLHASTNKPVGFFQWQVNEESCQNLKLDTDGSSSNVDITIGSWSNRDDDITFANVQLPLVLGRSNTGYRFDMNNGSWYVVKVASRNNLSRDVKLNAYCTTASPTNVSYRLGGGDAVLMDGGYKWNGNASVISHLFRDLYSRRYENLGDDWPFGAFKDMLKVRRSSEKPVVFFQWQRDDVCSSLTFDAELSSGEKRVDIHVKNWSASNESATVHSSVTLPYTIYDSSNNGNWRVIQIKFQKPVSYTANVTAKCSGMD